MRKRVIKLCAILCSIALTVHMLLWYVVPRSDGERGSVGLHTKADANSLHSLLGSRHGSRTNRITEQLAYIPRKLAQQPVMIFHADNRRSSALGFAEFERSQCRVRNCFITTLGRHKMHAQVLFFSPTSEVPLDFKRPLGQIWILHLLESPENTDSLEMFNGKINFTASYRWDSDIVAPYFWWNSSAKPVITGSSPIVRNYARGKTKKVAWFASHCLTNNGRREYAQKLQSFIQVDIFGDCGSHRIGREAGEELLRNKYKFYLSFENSNCRDYVTEKLFDNALSNYVIPIVMGPPRDFYERIAPPHSFIHVDDFEGPQHMASYLLKIDADDALFNSYFGWKHQGTSVDSKFWCRLCAVVQQPPHSVYDDIDSWWHAKDECVPTSDGQNAVLDSGNSNDWHVAIEICIFAVMLL